jgi:hypothetical protein
MPYFEPLGDAPDAADVQAVETGDEAEFGVVGHLDPQKPPAPIAHPLFRLFYQVEIRHRQLLQKQKPRSRGADLATIRCDYGDFTVAEYTISSDSAGWRQSDGCNPAPRPHPRKYQTDRVRDNRLTRALPSSGGHAASFFATY